MAHFVLDNYAFGRLLVRKILFTKAGLYSSQSLSITLAACSVTGGL